SNIYRIEPGKTLRHPAEADLGLTVAALLSLLVKDEHQRTAPVDDRHADTS
ncbi:MarR family transcriptional regulator, partial [Streptomyces sp. NPDC045470]